ncbi:unnamed protein product [Gongylonema pulchrum]|uniref:RING-CH-type domain-containing protein n=1 Tax=Gongylonema pulchrum TaxID=637853 RepID=A0A3P7MBI3_9BILA|nr:unnamed protein product [Gongylonema pulchrum]
MSDENISEWLSPCKCLGTIKWVHTSCFEQWMDVAANPMKYRCAICSYVYRRQWKLKPYKLWHWPRLNLGFSDILEIYIDISLTYRLFRDLPRCLDSKISFMVYSGFALLWKIFVGTNARLSFYLNLGHNLAASISYFTVLNAI